MDAVFGAAKKVKRLAHVESPLKEMFEPRHGGAIPGDSLGRGEECEQRIFHSAGSSQPDGIFVLEDERD